ncbi:MAG: fimbrillin family protein, partial [Bacteroidales bacterium]|nr:fimbrillin family protein [Bacteroidales bacterium]
TNSNKPGVVNMKFYHTLTMVKFKVKTDKEYTGTTITLKSISLAGVNTVGTLTPANTTSAWSAQGTPATFNVFPEGTKALNTTAVFVPTGTEKDDAYLMIPQRLSDAAVATITYSVKTGNDAETTNTATVKLNTSNVKAWDMNKNIVYTFVVGLKPIQFIAEVNDWDAVTGADFNVGF